MTDFSTFWSEYPRKQAKKKAEAIWNRLSKKKRLIILADIKIRFKEIEKRFIPYPTTYLNGEYWECEIEVINKSPATDEEWRKFGEKVNVHPRPGEEWPKFKQRVQENM